MEHLLLQKNACFVKSSLLTTTSLNKQSAGTLVSISSSLHALSCSSSFHLSLSYAKAQQTLFPFKLSPGFFCRRGKKERKKKWGGGGSTMVGEDRIISSSAGHSSSAWKIQLKSFILRSRDQCWAAAVWSQSPGAKSSQMGGCFSSTE